VWITDYEDLVQKVRKYENSTGMRLHPPAPIRLSSIGNMDNIVGIAKDIGLWATDPMMAELGLEWNTDLFPEPENDGRLVSVAYQSRRIMAVMMVVYGLQEVSPNGADVTSGEYRESWRAAQMPPTTMEDLVRYGAVKRKDDAPEKLQEELCAHQDWLDLLLMLDMCRSMMINELRRKVVTKVHLDETRLSLWLRLAAFAFGFDCANWNGLAGGMFGTGTYVPFWTTKLPQPYVTLMLITHKKDEDMELLKRPIGESEYGELWRTLMDTARIGESIAHTSALASPGLETGKFKFKDPEKLKDTLENHRKPAYNWAAMDAVIDSDDTKLEQLYQAIWAGMPKDRMTAILVRSLYVFGKQLKYNGVPFIADLQTMLGSPYEPSTTSRPRQVAPSTSEVNDESPLRKRPCEDENVGGSDARKKPSKRRKGNDGKRTRPSRRKKGKEDAE